MGKGIVIRDVDDLRKFNTDLRRFVQELSDSAKRIDNHCIVLGESWQDDEYKRFLNEWEQSIRMINRFIEKTNEFNRHLALKEAKARDYLSVR